MNTDRQIRELLKTHVEPLNGYLYQKMVGVLDDEDERQKREGQLLQFKKEFESDLLKLVVEERTEEDEELVERLRKALKAIDYYYGDSTEDMLLEAEKLCEEVYPLHSK